MNVLVACEFSGVVRQAFRALGHNAWSCDLLPAEDGSEFHFTQDIQTVLLITGGNSWDLLIAHPPCTYLTVSGNAWFKDSAKAGPGILTGESRRKAQSKALQFVDLLWSAPIGRIALENPIGRLSSLWMKPTQIIQPWMFGHGETKATCLWLRGLPRLMPTHRKDDLFCTPEPKERLQRLHKLPPGPTRAKERSRTFYGIANAMAAQWGAVSVDVAQSQA